MSRAQRWSWHHDPPAPSPKEKCELAGSGVVESAALESNPQDAIAGAPAPRDCSRPRDPAATGAPRTPRSGLAESRARVSVLVADAHPLYREALEGMIEGFSAFALLTAHDGETLEEALERLRPRVLLIDPASTGVDPAAMLTATPDRTRVLIITSNPKQAEIHAAIEAGATGYLGKDCPARELCDVIAAVGRGEARLGESIQPPLASEIHLRATVPRDYLTTREREILLLMAQGLSAPEIAARLFISTATVKTHQHHIYERLGVHDRAAAVAVAMRRGLIE